MSKFTVVLVAGVWIYCGSQARAQEPPLVPGPPSPVKVGQGSGCVLLADINLDEHLDLVTDASESLPARVGVVRPKRVRLSRTRLDIADGFVPSRSVATKTRLIRGHDKITQTA